MDAMDAIAFRVLVFDSTPPQCVTRPSSPEFSSLLTHLFLNLLKILANKDYNLPTPRPIPLYTFKLWLSKLIN